MPEKLHPQHSGDQHPADDGIRENSNRKQHLQNRLRELLIPKIHEGTLRRLLELRKKGTSQGYENNEHTEYLDLQDQLLKSDDFGSLREIEVALVQLAIEEEDSFNGIKGEG